MRAYNTGRVIAKTEVDHAKNAYTTHEKRENFKNKVFRTKYPPEKKGFKKVGIYKKGSKMLAWAISCGKRDGYTVQGITITDKIAGNYILLFSKKAKTQRKTTAAHSTIRKNTTTARRAGRRTTTPKVQMWHGLPLTKVIGGATYHLQTRFDSDEDFEAKEEARAYRQDGYKVKLQFICDQWGEKKYALYTAGRRKSKSSY